jgi:hypothetical protein
MSQLLPLRPLATLGGLPEGGVGTVAATQPTFVAAACPGLPPACRDGEAKANFAPLRLACSRSIA